MVLPVLAGMTVSPSFVAASCTPIPPVNSPYPWAFWRTSFFEAPQETIPRWSESAQLSRSVCVYPTTVGFPVVPEETWILTRSS